MLLKMLQLIGKYVVEDKKPIEILVDQQKSYKSKYILTIGISPDSDDLDHLNFQFEEYDDNKRYQYLRGTVGGGGSSYSPSLNINLNALKKYTLPKNISQEVPNWDMEKWLNFVETEEGKKFYKILIKAINFSRNISNSLKKDPLIEREDNAIEKKLFLWVKKHEKELTIRVFHYMLDNFINYDKNELGFKIENEIPNTIILNILVDGTEHYPGDLMEFRKLYLDMDSDKIDKLRFNSSCYICSSNNKYLLKPNIGIFNLNMHGFVQGFTPENQSVQFSVCNDCNDEIKVGFEFVNENLNFYAYKTRKGTFGNEGQYINHYIIPVIDDEKLLKKAVKTIIRAKITIGDQKIKSFQSRIDELEKYMRKVESHKKSELKKKLKNLESLAEQNPEELGQKADLSALIENLSELPVNYLDIYYYITDNKQNPSTKEIIGFYQVAKTAIQRINDVIRNMKQQGKKIEIYKIRQVVSEKFFLNILDSLYQEKSLNEIELARQAHSIISSPFQNNILDIKKDETPYYILLDYFKQVYELLFLNGLIDNKGDMNL